MLSQRHAGRLTHPMPTALPVVTGHNGTPASVNNSVQPGSDAPPKPEDG